MMYRLCIILITSSSGLLINEEQFKIYALKTASVYLKWYNIPTTIHRILVHEHIIKPNAVVANKGIKNYGSLIPPTFNVFRFFLFR